MASFPDDPLLLDVPRPPRDHATRMSGGAALGGRQPSAIARVAQASLFVLAAMTSSGCLITDTPQFKAPKHTQPLLDPTTADPNPGDVLVVEESAIKLQGTQSRITFSADVTSREDGPDVTDNTFKQLFGYLYVDYGSTADPRQPYTYKIDAQFSEPDASGKRHVSATWLPGVPYSDLGCHRLTLVVAHAFDPELRCPRCDDDYSMLTWQVFRCDQSGGDCNNMPLAGAGSCEGLTNTCAKARDALADAGIEPASCPSGAAADGGSP